MSRGEKLSKATSRPNMVAISVRVTVAQADALCRRAVKSGRSIGECLRAILDLALRADLETGQTNDGRRP